VTVGVVRGAAMAHFQVKDDSQFTYVLAHDGQEQNDATPLSEIAGHAQAVKFTLVKKITQG
jgi:regulator of PEP synthase PpsR (kinase-PPPase family)